MDNSKKLLVKTILLAAFYFFLNVIIIFDLYKKYADPFQLYFGSHHLRAKRQPKLFFRFGKIIQFERRNT